MPNFPNIDIILIDGTEHKCVFQEIPEERKFEKGYTHGYRLELKP